MDTDHDPKIPRTPLPGTSAGVGAALLVCSFLLGYRLAPREILDQQVTYDGPFTIDTKRVLAATVESLRSRNRLVSYSYVGTQHVQIHREKWLLFEGRQTLIVPVDVSYFVDLARLSDADVRYDPSKNELTITAPQLRLRVDFLPHLAREFNEGSITWFSDEVRQELRSLNYETATRAAIKQGQQPEFVRLATKQTEDNIAAFFTIALQAAGHGTAKVRVSLRAT